MTWLLLAGACAINPATRRLELRLMGENAEIELGRDLHRQVVTSIGVVEAPPVGEYVTRVGRRMAAVGERPALPWSFAVLDDPAVNAFALPGGFVYVTRGLLAHLSDEAELAAVLGHEVGHVNARHGVDQYNRARLAQRGVGLFRIVDPHLQHVGGFVAGVAELSLLRHSRAHELEADGLAVSYLGASGYPRGAMVGVLAMLSTVQESAGGQVPPWLSTHPDPQVRLQAMSDLHGQTGTPQARGADRYLPHVVGLTFGDDPREGFIRSGRFYWPTRNLEVALPPKWQAVARDGEMVAASADEAAIMLIASVQAKNAVVAEERLFAAGGLEPVEHSSTTVSDYPARVTRFRAQDRGRELAGVVAFVEHPAGVVAMLALAPASAWSRHEPVVSESLASWSSIANPQIRTVTTPALVLVRVEEASLTLAALAAKRPSAVPVEVLARINRVPPEQALAGGTLVKWVEGGLPPDLSEPADGEPAVEAEREPAPVSP